MMCYNFVMSQTALHKLPAGAVLLGVLLGAALWGLALGVQVRRHEPGLWTVRFQRLLDCGFDYNGAPFTTGSTTLWLTCGGEDNSLQLWPR